MKTAWILGLLGAGLLIIGACGLAFSHPGDRPVNMVVTNATIYLLDRMEDQAGPPVGRVKNRFLYEVDHKGHTYLYVDGHLTHAEHCTNHTTHLSIEHAVRKQQQ